MATVTIKVGATRDEVTIHTMKGDQVIDRSGMSSGQKEALRESLVSFWCDVNGYPSLYPNARKV